MGVGNRIPEPRLMSSKTDESKMDKSKKQEASISFVPEEPRYDLCDIILPQNVRDDILDVADYARNSRIVFEQWGLSKTHKYSKRMGINLYGPPGTGKTMAAHAIAKHLGRKILEIAYCKLC